jgi:N-methylhydantoinase A/oxoprolinase/acetone carboxylase beta subunit
MMEIREAGQLGLGVDCGGTYTDAVIYDFDSGEVLASRKYPTTHFDLTLCIDGVLGGLPPEMLRQSRLVCLSATLATNAIVEGKGGKACLMLMGYDPAMTVTPYGAKVVRIAGGHNVRGGETEPLDEESLRRVIRENDEWADAFAVSGYFSVRNPQHEIRAHSIIAEETGKPIVCGHELSMQLDAPRRATTAAINARLIPLIARLISSVQSILKRREISAPLMVVRGDGTLMGAEMALQRPVETILSGPAASVVGAMVLSGREEGVVIDVGGTTTDIAWVEEGLPPINSEGAVVGGLATRVEAIDIWTVGLGGDSWIKLAKSGTMEVGPRRVLPLALLGNAPYVSAELERLRQAKPRGTLQDLLTFWVGMDYGSTAPSRPDERKLMDRLEQGPLSHFELKTSPPCDDATLRILSMEHDGSVFRASLTPTDIFNTAGDSEVGNVGLSKAVVETAAFITGRTPEELVAEVKQSIEEAVIREVLTFLLGVGRAEKTLLDAWRRGKTIRGVQLSLSLQSDILAAGAPASLFLEPVAEDLSCSCLTPPHTEVANAVGAVAGVVSHREEIIIRRQQDESYRAFASDGRYDYPSLSSATEAASEKACELATDIARQAGADEIKIDERSDDFTFSDSAGESVVFERKIIARAFGRPRIG